MRDRKLLQSMAGLGLLLATVSNVPSAIASDKHDHRTTPGSTVRNATDKANANAGSAKEVEPDSKQSATGGQSGGMPGHQ